MKNLLLLTLFIAPSAFALQATNCSNSDGSLTRVENEIWGANPVTYTVNGQQNDDSKVEVSFTKKKVLNVVRYRDRSGTVIETYAALLKVKGVDGAMIGPGPNGTEIALIETQDYVVCKAWSNNARD
jgi:hypothetical protein